MPNAEPSLSEAGTDAGGFRINGSPQATLRIEVWGYWSPEVATRFVRDAPPAVQRLTPAAAFVLDAAHLKPQAAGGQEGFRTLFRALSALTFAGGKIIAKNALTCMQLMRLLRECKMDDRLKLGDV